MGLKNLLDVLFPDETHIFKPMILVNVLVGRGGFLRVVYKSIYQPTQRTIKHVNRQTNRICRVNRNIAVIAVS